jgi:predicted signal transduction protein with EAL and GGDEF domain
MESVGRIKGAFTVDGTDPELVLSQMEEFGRQIPLLYFMVVANTIAVAVTHIACAPARLAIHIPAALCAICLIRCVRWWFFRHQTLTHEKAVPVRTRCA